MPLPADQDPFTLMQAAAEHVRNGVPEVELEWWADPEDSDGTPQRRLTITLRNVDRWARVQAAAEGWTTGGNWPDTIPDDMPPP